MVLCYVMLCYVMLVVSGFENSPSVTPEG